jgi:hypothetical protein
MYKINNSDITICYPYAKKGKFFIQLITTVLLLVSFIKVSSAQSPCGVEVIFMPTPEIAQASLDPITGQPIIIVHPLLSQMVGPAGYRYTLAHECAHHVLGHVYIQLRILQQNPYAMPWFTVKRELEADHYAAQYLRSIGDFEAIQAGMVIVGSSGPFPSGPNYPTGFQRIQAIKNGAGIP